MVRAKFRVESVTHHAHGARTVKLSAVTADGIPENERFHKWTPSGSIEMAVDNPAAFEQFVPGAFYFIDFAPQDTTKAD